jgi:hypothetical protein
MNHRIRSFTNIAVVAATIAAAPYARAADPTTADCLTASLASLKLGNEHKVRQERAQLLVCAAESCPADIRKECMRRVDEVNGAIPTIIFGAKDGAGNDLSAVKVTMDGEVLADRLEGTALSIDPGAHTFVFESGGLPTVERHFVIQQGQKDRREAIVFDAAGGTPSDAPAGPAAPAPVLAAPRPPAEPASAATTAETPADSSASVKRIVGYSLIGLSVVGVGIAIAEQVTAVSRANDSTRAAQSPDPAVQDTAAPTHDQAAQAQTYAIVFGAAGAVALGAGLYLVLSARSADAPPKAATAAATKPAWRIVPELGPQRSGLVLQGTF